jgi:serine/threonine protein phosphatase 1
LLTRIKVVGPEGEPHKRSHFPTAPRWSELRQRLPFVIYEHTPRLEPMYAKWSLGPDTSCALGGALTACMLPGREIVQVRARQKY